MTHLGEKIESHALAGEIGKAFGDGTGVWLRMQAVNGAWQTERAADVRGVKLIRADHGGANKRLRGLEKHSEQERPHRNESGDDW